MRSQCSKINPLLKRCELSDLRLIWGSREERDATVMKGEDENLGAVSCSPVKHQEGEMAASSFVQACAVIAAANTYHRSHL